MMSDRANLHQLSGRIRLAIVDDHPAVRRALLVRFESVPHVNVMVVDTELPQALQHARDLMPDVILLGLRSSRRPSVHSLAQNVATLANLGVGVIVLTSYVDVVEREALLNAGAKRYLLKNIDFGHHLAAIEAVAAERLAPD